MPEMERRSFSDWPLQVFRSLSLDSHPNSKHHRAGFWWRSAPGGIV